MPEIGQVAAARQPHLFITVDNGIASIDGAAVRSGHGAGMGECRQLRPLSRAAKNLAGGVPYNLTHFGRSPVPSCPPFIAVPGFPHPPCLSLFH